MGTVTKLARRAGVVSRVQPFVANKFPVIARKLSRSAVLACAFGVALAGCSTVDSRIARNRAAFDSWPAEVQEKIAAGQIDIGFTTDQVRVALGEPDRMFTRTTADGTSEVWSYRDRGPRIGFGVGVGMGGWHGSRGVGGGVGIGSSGGYHDDEKLGIVFDPAGRVSAVEERRR